MILFHPPIHRRAVTDGIDMPVLVLEFQFLVFLAQQAFIDTGIRTDFTRFQKAAEIDLKQGLFNAFLSK
jgi:hypothetical protein